MDTSCSRQICPGWAANPLSAADRRCRPRSWPASRRDWRPPMHVVLITHELSRTDGQGRVNLHLAHYLLARGHTVHAIARHVDPALRDLAGFSMTRVPVPRRPYLLEAPLFMLFAGLALRRTPRAAIRVNNGTASLARAQVNYCHYCHAAFRHVSRGAAHGLVGRLRHGYQRACTTVNALAERYVYRRRSETIIAISTRIRDELVQAAGVDPGRIQVVRNGVDPDEFRPPHDPAERAALRRHLAVPAGPLVLFAGDLRSPRKGLSTLLRALSLLPEPVMLLVAGDARGSPFVEEARTLGLAERVMFLGFRRDMPLLMRAADLFAFPALYEPFSLVVLEAMASGLPVVTTTAAGASELIIQGVNGVALEDPDDHRALARAMQGILDDRDLSHALGRAARATALQYTWAHTMSRLEAILMSFVA
jgi:glycosyltransferase involved in cell wall biosynthesis